MIKTKLFLIRKKARIEEYFEKMAAKGFFPDKTNNFSIHFKKTEPKNVKFAVTYFPSASFFDPKPSEKQLAFHDFCEHTGWKLAATDSAMQIFYNEQPDAVPIETDPLMEFQNYNRTMIKSYLPFLIIALFNGLLQTVLFAMRVNDNPLTILSNNYQLLSQMCHTILLCGSSIYVISYFLWYKRTLKYIEMHNEIRSYKNPGHIMLFLLSIMLLGLALQFLSFGGAKMIITAGLSIVGVFIVTTIILMISVLLKKINVPRTVNLTVTIIATLVLSILFTVLFLNGINYFIDSQPQKNHSEIPEEMALTIEKIISEDYSSSIDEITHYIICYNSCIADLEFRNYPELTKEQITIIKDALTVEF